MKNVFNLINIPIKKQVNFRSIRHVIYTITNNKIALHKFNDEDEEIKDEDWTTTYPLGSNIAVIKYFDEKDTPNSIEESKKQCEKFIENDQL